MSNPLAVLANYLHLARAAALRRRPLVTDRLLVLAAALSQRLELPRVAAYCRHKIVTHNPRHMVARWPQMAEALDDYDFQHLLRQNQRRYPPEKAERMLETLGIDVANERAAYFSDEEYCAALLGVTPAVLQEMFGESG